MTVQYPITKRAWILIPGFYFRLLYSYYTSHTPWWQKSMFNLYLRSAKRSLFFDQSQLVLLLRLFFFKSIPSSGSDPIHWYYCSIVFVDICKQNLAEFVSTRRMHIAITLRSLCTISITPIWNSPNCQDPTLKMIRVLPVSKQFYLYSKSPRNILIFHQKQMN